MPRDGFSLMTVMIGSVVVAGLAIVYMQKAKNKAQIAAIADIIAYRDYVFRYYHEIAANRMAWQCTLNANPNLKNYVRGSGGALGPHPLKLYDISGTGCVLGGGTGEERIPGSGRGLKLYTEPDGLPVETYDPDNPNHDLRVWTTWEGLGQERVRIRLAATYNYEHDTAITSFKIKEKETFIYMGRTPARNCGESLGHLGFHDDRGLGNTAPKRYFGDTAVTSLNAKTRLVTCWEDGPLVIPPCFDLLERAGGSYSFHATCPSLGTNKDRNYAGMCPKETALLVPAIGGFASDTGKTICEKDYALVLGDRQSEDTAFDGYCAGDHVALVGLKANHRPECSPGDRFGTRGGRASEGIAGFTTSGVIAAGGNVGSPGARGKTGHACVIRTKGDTGDPRDCPCNCPPSTCSVDSDCDTTTTDAHGNTITTPGTCSTSIALCPSYRSC